MSTISSFPNSTSSSNRLADDPSGAERLERQLFVALFGGVLLLAAWIAKLLDIETTVANIPALVGALVLVVPLAKGALEELREGRASSDSLACLAVFAAIANELYLKRLIVGGFDGVFEFSRNFRNEGMDRTHNPEFTVMELYVAYKDYIWMMDFIEGVFGKVASAANGTPTAKFQGKEISFAAPFKRITMVGSIEEKIGLNVLDMEEEDIRALCMKHHIEVAPSMGKGKLIDELFSTLVQPELIQPTFVTDFPVEMSPLCKKHREDPRLTERFELFVAGFEVANAYSELNDPIDQRQRFEEQLKLMERGDDEAMFIDQDFLRALEYGMPPTSGIGIGMDRLVMLLTDNPAIQEVLLFPQMRPEKFE